MSHGNLLGVWEAPFYYPYLLYGTLGPTELIMYGTWAGVQYVLYKIGARADRKVLLVVLRDIGTETSEIDQDP